MRMELGPQSLQKMMLTPKMLLSMHVLQLNIADLRTFLLAEFQENPLLEEETVSAASPDDDEAELAENLSMVIDEDAQDDEGRRRYAQTLVTKEESLYEHLCWQLNVLAADAQEKRIGEFIISSLDDNGFLAMPLDQMRGSLNADIESFKRALTLVRSFDPLGVGARDLKESLLIQLVSSGKADTNLYRIVYAHLEDLEKGRHEKIAHALSLPLEEVETAKKRISCLNPRPGASYGKEGSGVAIEPDVFLSRDNGVYGVALNERDLPRFKVSRFYSRTLRDGRAPQGTKEYIRKKLSAALWLIAALKQRQKTIARVCEYLVDYQRDFLENGDAAVRPLTLAQAASSLAVSQATVSRVVSNKYAQVGDRLFSFKAFFSGHLKTSDNGFISDRIARQKIQDMIATEDSRRPLNDTQIAASLKKEGIRISRRTVTKYRQSFKILPWHLRKSKT